MCPSHHPVAPSAAPPPAWGVLISRAHTTTTEGDETALLAFLGPQDSVKLTWRYQPEETEVEPSPDLAEEGT